MSVLIVLVVFLCLYVLIFEFINGFHDTANAVATVIYTRSLKPRLAVMRSGLWNLVGVMLGGVGVALSIVKILPLDGLVHSSFVIKTAFFLALLLSSIVWNIYTWYKGLPCSSMHALIGSIIGTTFAYVHTQGLNISLIPRHKLSEIFQSLILSPIVGFFVTMVVVSLLYRFFHKSNIFDAPHKREPSLPIRISLIFAQTAVSFAHGANDGQKGIGMMMALLVVYLPNAYNLNYIPWWVIAVIACVLGIGTMIGRKRIVKTIGEKIGKHHMTYAQGGAAEIVAAGTIALSTFAGLPVSTTHVLSSGVAGAMSATGGMKELQMGTLKHIALAWVLTLPATIVMGYVFYFIAVRYTK